MKPNLVVIIGGVLILLGSVFATWYLTKNSISADVPVTSTATTATTGSTATSATTGAATTTTTTTGSTAASKISIILQPGYNLISFPYILSPNDGKTVLIGLSLKEAWTMVSGQWTDLFTQGNLTPGVAYWIHSLKGEVYDLPVPATAVDATKPFSIVLKKGWNAIGNPFAADIAWNPTVTTVKGSTTLQKALDNKIIGTSFSADPVGNKYLEVKPGDTLRKFGGVVIESGGDNVTLLIDPTTAISK